MTTHSRPRLRRLILLGTPLLTGILLVFHPLPDPAHMQQAGTLEGGLEMYLLLAPIAGSFLAVHAVFALMLALLGLAVMLLLDGVRGLAADLSRACAFLFSVAYILYETIIGTTAALLVRGGAGLSPAEQALIGDAVYRIYKDPYLGDLPSAVSLIAWLSWVLAVILAAVALRRAGKPLAPCILLGLSFIFVSHASMLGPLGMLLFLLAALGLERSPATVAEGMDYAATAST